MLRLFLCLLAVGVGGSGVASAAEARRSSGSSKKALRRQAKGLFKQAQIQYRLGRFARARKLYTRAYVVLPLPGFLFNIAQCHRMEKRYERAVFFYKSYLSAKPGARNRDTVLELLRRSEQGLKQQHRETAARRRAVASRRRATRPVLVVTPRPYLPRPTPSRTPVTKKWWFWTSLGAGVAAAVVAGVVAGLLTRPPGFEATDLGTLDRRAR